MVFLFITQFFFPSKTHVFGYIDDGTSWHGKAINRTKNKRKTKTKKQRIGSCILAFSHTHKISKARNVPKNLFSPILPF